MRERDQLGDPEFFEKIRNETSKEEVSLKVLAPNGQAPHEFRLVHFSDIHVDGSRPYLVHGLIPREGLIDAWGAPKCGKTFWAFDLVMHIALGWSYRGRRVEQGTVVYIACEGERGLKARKEAFRQTNLADSAPENVPFYLLTTRLDLPHQVDTLILDIAAQIPAVAVGVIVLDTLNRSIGGSESKDEDMGAYVAAAAALVERFRCAVIIIHHCGIDGSRPRGHTSLTGAVDAQIAIKRDVAGRIVATVEYMKDGPEGDTIVSELKVVEVGADEDGEMITSCVIAPVEGEDAKNAKPAVKSKPLPPAAQIALDQLRNALAAEGKIPPACNHIPPNTPAVDYDLWRRYSYSAGISDADSAEARKKAFGRATEKLIANRVAFRWESWVWIPQPGQTGHVPGRAGTCP